MCDEIRGVKMPRPKRPKRPDVGGGRSAGARKRSRNCPDLSVEPSRSRAGAESEQMSGRLTDAGAAGERPDGAGLPKQPGRVCDS